MEMKSKVVMVDPTLAVSWLAKNAQHNRPIRKTTVADYAQQMRNGAWQLTHQGLAFDVNGVLIDGQHRLAAIVQAGVIVPMMVTVNAPSTSFESLDCGVKRSIADLLAIDRRLVAVLTSAEVIANGNNRSVKQPRIRELTNSTFGKIAQAVIDSVPSQKRIMSSSWVAVAACVAIAEGQDFEWVVEQRRVLVAQDEDNETPSAKCFRRRFQDTRIETRGAFPQEVLSCALRVFDYKSRDIKVVKLFDGWQQATQTRVKNAMETQINWRK